MGQPQNVRRYRANPVEFVILLIITTIFVNSVYNLFYQHPGYKANALRPLASTPISEGRAPASVSQSLISLDLTCEGSVDKTTTASKIRVKGPLCGSDTTSAERSLIKTQIANTSNQFNATVFTDGTQFSTDYLPLNPGKNTIHVEFSYRNGETYSKDILVTKD